MTIFKYIIFDFKNNNIILIKKENLFFSFNFPFPTQNTNNFI